jgi:hypothetical protein
MNKETVVVNDHLQELRSSGFEMVKGDPDIRGWKVLLSNEVPIGKIKELLFDVYSKKVRYVIMELEGKPINLVSRDVIIPVGLAELDQTENLVYLPDVTIGHLATLPEYKKGKITFKTERDIRDVFMPGNSKAADKLAEFEASNNPEREAFYNNEYYDETRMLKRRRMAERLENRTYEKEKELADPEKNVHNSDTVQPGNVAYIPDENDPSVLRKVKIIRDTD